MADPVTKLQLNPIGVPPYSARSITQTLERIEQGFSPAFTVDGDVINMANPYMQRYRSIITCFDLYAPALGGVKLGDELEVYCVAEESYLTATGAASRPIVPGSQYVEGDFTYYCPILTMVVTYYSSSEAEREKQVNWELGLLEKRSGV